jgi:competence protein ComEA
MRSRVQLALGIAVVAALVVLGTMIWADRVAPVTISVEAPSPEPMRVSISGGVERPGVVEVPAGARLVDVVDAAGGFVPDADTDQLNLAGRIGDGERIEIPIKGQEPEPPVAGPSGEALIDLNTASAAELDDLPGIGEVLAGRIVEYRETRGPFTSVDQLEEVEGISSRLVDQLRPFITVSPDG